MFLKKHSVKIFFLFAVLSLFWSASFLGIKFSIATFPPIFAALLRVSIAFLALSILFLFMKVPLRLSTKSMLQMWFLGTLSQGLAFICLFAGEQYISPALAGIINSTVPLWVLLINGLILREKNTFSLKKTMGLLLGFIGILFIFVPLVHDSHEHESGLLKILGAVFVSGMAISYAAGGILYQKIQTNSKINFKAGIWHQHIGSFLFLLVCSLLFDSWPDARVFSLEHYQAWLAVLYLGIFSTAIAWIIYSYLIITVGMLQATIVLYIVPMLAVIWDMLFLHLTMHFHEYLGIFLILLGVLFAQRLSKTGNS